MKKIISAAALLVIILGANACRFKQTVGAGQIKTEQRAIQPFTKLRASAALHVIVTIDSNSAARPTVQIEAYENLLPHIQVRQSGSELKIETVDGGISSDKEIIVHITTPSLSSLQFSGSTSAEVKGKLKGDNLEVTVTGAGDVIIDGVYVNEIKAKASGSGTLSINDGYAQEATYHISGAGNIDAYGLVTQQAEANVSGAGNLQLNVIKNLDARISGAGDIDYKGQPTVSSHISGAGTLKKEDK